MNSSYIPSNPQVPPLIHSSMMYHGHQHGASLPPPVSISPPHEHVSSPINSSFTMNHHSYGSLPSTASSQQSPYPSYLVMQHMMNQKPHNTHQSPPAGFVNNLATTGDFSVDEVVKLLSAQQPGTLQAYGEHLHKICSVLYENEISSRQYEMLQNKYYSLMDLLPSFIDETDPINSKLYLLIEKCFDVLIKISTNHKNVDVATKSIRFLTSIIMNLNYWEIYNLLSWKPSIYHFLNLIHYNFQDSYTKFINDYSKYNHAQSQLPADIVEKVKEMREARKRRSEYQDSDSEDDVKSASPTPLEDENDKYFNDQSLGLSAKEKKRIRADAKLAANKLMKTPQAARQSNKSANYDPDVVHECKLPSADEPNKPCSRRFSRKYELIRHQETVHSKKKKLFKCYVCVKECPNIGPRIFTRHDTLAKHIRVNHKISGKDAKAEVAYSKKHAEVVEEGDITVHVGRRKTKVDFELRAHMEKKKPKDSADGDIIDDMIEDAGPNSIYSGDEME